MEEPKIVEVPRPITSTLASNVHQFWFFANRSHFDSFITDVLLYLNNVELFNALLVSRAWKDRALSPDIWHYPSDDSQDDAMSESLPNVSDSEHDSNSAWEHPNYLSLTSNEVLDENVDISSYFR